jgi:hypothetical protein
MFGDRLRALLAGFARETVEATLAAHPRVREMLLRGLVGEHKMRGTTEAAVFLPGVWDTWPDMVYGEVLACHKTPLRDLASRASAAH